MPKSYWLILAAVLAVIIIFLGIRAFSNSSTSPSSTPQASAQTQVYKMSIQNGQINPTLPLAINSKVGTPVNFGINVDENGQIHFHNGENEFHQDVRVGDNSFSETFTQAGNWSVEFHPAINNKESSSAAIEIDDTKPGINLGEVLVSP